MLDEQHMDKKTMPPRGPLAPAKSAANETKSKQDGTGANAKFSRSARKRDGLASKQEPAVKWQQQQPQRQKGNYDRRFQARNAVAPFNDRRRNQVASSLDETEIGSADRPGSKKINLNHLLNFTYDRPEGARASSGHPWGNGGGHNENHGRAMWTTRKHKYNKEQFLQANCQFVVRCGHDYSVHAADPDLLVDWEWIEQVRVTSHEAPSCPICLYPPVTAKMTRCGHIYCWPCILHYLALSDKTWRKCPICYEAVHKTDLKSVVAISTPCFNVGDKISMRLMRREKGSVVAVPKARHGGDKAAAAATEHPFRLDDEGVNQCYAKLLMATRKQVLESVVEREEAELGRALLEYAACPEICFIESAIEQLKERKAALLADAGFPELEFGADEGEEKYEEASVSEWDKDGEPTEEDARASLSEDGADGGESRSVDAFLADSAIGAGGNDGIENGQTTAASSGEDNDAKGGRGGGGSTSSKSAPGSPVYYFYQACDGQQIFLHAINVHMLVREFGRLEDCPDVVTAVIVAKEGISMNEDLRRRLRYLGHLPLICEFEVVELQFEGAGIVSEDTLAAFAEEIEKRQRGRNRRAREEHKRERQFRADENRRWGKTPEAKLRLNSLKHFPECARKRDEDKEDEEDKEEEGPRTPQTPASDNGSTTFASGSVPTDNAYAGASFAQMLRKGKMKSDAAASSSPPRHPSSWAVGGATAVVSPLGRGGGGGGSDEDEEDEASLHAPSFRDSFCAALQDALDRSAANANANAAADDSSDNNNKKKKRGRRQRLLFSTAAIARSK